jgi:hypothetical protein
MNLRFPDTLRQGPGEETMLIQEISAIARDWAIILLCLEGILLSLVPLFLLYKLAQGLGRLVGKARSGLRLVRERVFGVMESIQEAMRKIQMPFIWLASTGAAMRGWAGGIRHSLTRGR